MTNYEALKEKSLEEMAFVLYKFIEPFLGDDEKLKRKARKDILEMLKEEKRK